MYSNKDGTLLDFSLSTSSNASTFIWLFDSENERCVFMVEINTFSF